MSISAAEVKKLRELTGAGVLDCRNALAEAEGDTDRAVELLREKGLAKAARRADRDTSNGLIELYNHGDGQLGVIVEVNCETDFVARTEAFRTFAHEIALQIAANSPRWIRMEDVPAEVLAEEREDAKAQAVADGKPEKVIDRIVEGKLQKFLDDNCLLRQPYIRDDTKGVAELLDEVTLATGEKVTIRRFERWSVGDQRG